MAQSLQAEIKDAREAHSILWRLIQRRLVDIDIARYSLSLVQTPEDGQVRHVLPNFHLRE